MKKEIVSYTVSKLNSFQLLEAIKNNDSKCLEIDISRNKESQKFLDILKGENNDITRHYSKTL